MDYIVLNGKKSNQINGLMIQKLPDVVKPLIRTEIEEIDGKDGDLVTKLGYSAYDKELLIGLHGNFDINQVISYFDSEGEVIFSNEPDKIYRYQILEEINFEKLIRYRTATVTFHCQPFKYSAIESNRNMVVNNQILHTQSYSNTKNGLSLVCNDNLLYITGTASQNTEFYIPLMNLECNSGQYYIKGESSGTCSDVISFMIINNMPNTAHALGGSILRLGANDNTTIKTNQAEKLICNYLYIFIPEDAVLNSSFEIQVQQGYAEIYNMGNTYSHPTLKIIGDGRVVISINDKPIFVIMLTDYKTIIIDVDEMQAYIGDVLLNRYVLGDYDDLMFKKGRNIITWDGDVSTIELSDFSRWI